jgi:hypothetical protein
MKKNKIIDPKNIDIEVIGDIDCSINGHEIILSWGKLSFILIYDKSEEVWFFDESDINLEFFDDYLLEEIKSVAAAVSILKEAISDNINESYTE